MLETLTCSHGHPWQRERTRGRKPPTCPEHKGSVQANTPRPAEGLTEPHSPISDAMLDVLTRPGVDSELLRKLSYAVEQADSPRREDDDRALMRATAERLVVQANRSL